MSQQNIEATRNGYAAFGAGDLQAALSIFDDAVEWTVAGDSLIGGTYRGRGEITGLLTQLAEKSTSVTTKTFVADGDIVVALTEVSVAGGTFPEADVFTFRDGRVIKAQSFGDTAAQERIFGTKQTAAAV